MEKRAKLFCLFKFRNKIDLATIDNSKHLINSLIIGVLCNMWVCCVCTQALTNVKKAKAFHLLQINLQLKDHRLRFYILIALKAGFMLNAFIAFVHFLVITDAYQHNRLPVVSSFKLNFGTN